MKKFLTFAFLVGSFSLASLTVNATTNDYMCKTRASTVCALKISTGQCTHSWNKSEYPNAMAMCQSAIGNAVDNNYDSSNYYCRNFGSRACAVDSRTGQCTHAWTRDNSTDPMFSCEKFLGHGNGRVDKSNYTCSKTPTGACARNLRTGQCTHSWSSREFSNPMWSCQKYLNAN